MKSEEAPLCFTCENRGAMHDFRKILTFGNEKKNEFSFCISLIYSYLWLRRRYSRLENCK